MLNKLGDSKMVGEQTIKLILAVAVVLVLILLIYSLISPYFSKEKETAKSYLNTLKEQVSAAKSEGGGVFEMWQQGTKETRYFLVYFGSSSFHSEDWAKEYSFFARGLDGGKNKICVCYSFEHLVEGDLKKTVCDYCFNLDKPADYCGEQMKWMKPEKVKLFISEKDGRYNFCETK